jgi:retron-type reverse transcriptase
VTDRLIQQALLQVLQPILDPAFSEYSYGFRPGRRVQDAVLVARAYVQSGARIVVDLGLSKFFDRVNHDILIDRFRKRIADIGVIQLIRGGGSEQRHHGLWRSAVAPRGHAAGRAAVAAAGQRPA